VATQEMRIKTEFRCGMACVGWGKVDEDEEREAEVGLFKAPGQSTMGMTQQIAPQCWRKFTLHLVAGQ
jgi:hypothetical protein